MVLRSLFCDLAVFDAWRKLHPDRRSFSWTRLDGLMASRIDLFGFPLAWGHFVHLCDIVPDPFSDHNAVCLTASLPEPFAKGPGRWLFNVSLLQNPSFTAALETMSTALITLIFKKGDRLEHKNWRPISLLNVDYKICTRTVAGRLLKVLHHVIHPDQTCGVKGRFIGENVALLRDIVDFTSETGQPAAILSLDQEKAFDRVDWDFLFKTLDHMGFSPSFLKWVRLFYNDIRSAILVDGYRSGFFFPSRGVRQGCPLYPLLYVISIEILAAALRSCPDILGLKAPGRAVRLPTVLSMQMTLL